MSNDKEKEGYYPSRDEIKEDTKMLSKLKPDWMRSGYGYGGYGYGGGFRDKDGKTPEEQKEGKGKKGKDSKA